MQTIAIDTGYGRVKALGARQVDFPSVVAAFRPVRFTSGMEKGNTIDRMALEYNGRRYYVGSAALRQGIARATVDKARTTSEEALVLTLAAMSLLLDRPTEIIQLVAGLPVAHYASLKEQYRGLLKRDHKFDILSLTGEVLEYRYVKVHDCRVLPQPLGTLFNLLLNSAGDVIAPNLAGEKVGIIDVGYNTVDLAWVDSLEFVDRKSASYPLGVFTVFSELSEQLSRNLGIEAPPETLENVVKTGKIKVSNKVYGIEEQKHQALTSAAEQIASRVKTIWPDRWQLDKVIITGGGGQMLGEYLSQTLGERTEMVDAPMFANVEGFLKIGARTWKK